MILGGISEKRGSFARGNKSERHWLFAKRFFDLGMALVALAILLPLMCLVMVFVRIRLGSPVFFSHWRLGIHGQPFRIYKFRTMLEDHDVHGNLLPDEQRLTNFGKFLRKNSLDELPELLNVITGQMSLVGPRPLPIKYQERFSSIQWRRHEVKPGITGLVQISGRNALTWDEKFKLDVWYVDHWSFWLDIKILIGTILHLIHREGISHEGHVTMPEFFAENHNE